MSRWSRVLGAALLLAMTACAADPSPTPTVTLSPSATATPGFTATDAPSVSPSASPSASPEPQLSLPPPEGTDARVVAASVAAAVDAAGGTVTVTVSSAATDRIDEIVLRWPAELDATLRLAPFAPSDERIRDGGLPLRQEWTKWVLGPGEQGEPAGTISVGWGPLLPGATLEILLVATRVGAGPVSFDLQFLAGNDLLTFDAGLPAELRVDVP